ncbi:MAG: YcgN family cysteine cluster protein [Phaeovulum sp.]|uniref:YcgN family cysteine cluster protein n=1 Tax=Phaeovulum sp. TaxID=2934796 RepID=UPI00272FFE9C|nr:YcgN family cysteine cluster protein [Phaeovulum sp.]MDP2062592.1 YcgN family cysteine cluster protein [Phaeovulum sp.]MDP3860377.1 YcgN family cysteine cluster protein [Phaeovulum sp.]
MTPPNRPRFWELPLGKLTPSEWEALCDGCGKCCLNKLEFEDDGEVAFTRVACRLLDSQACRCKSYENRHQFVPECIRMTPRSIKEGAYWMPSTCAYRLRFFGKPLPDWHPLLTGDPESVHAAGQSVRGWTVSERDVPEADWEAHIIEDL